jgi:hydrogenase expression/formation protein HypC
VAEGNRLMCMSRPGRVIRIEGGIAEVETAGRRRSFNALMAPEAKPGDWVLTHTGLVISVIPEAEAKEAERAFLELSAAGWEEGA